MTRFVYYILENDKPCVSIKVNKMPRRHRACGRLLLAPRAVAGSGVARVGWLNRYNNYYLGMIYAPCYYDIKQIKRRWDKQKKR